MSEPSMDITVRVEVLQVAVAIANTVVGSGLPPGGTAGQILVKLSAADGDAEWQDPPESGGPSTTFTYRRPGGVDTYRRPGGIDTYIRP